VIGAAALAGSPAVTLDTLAYTKHLEQAGVERHQAEAHAEALNRYLLPDLVTKADLLGLEQRMEHRMQAMEQRLLAAFENRLHQVEIRMLGVVAAMLGLLFALLKFTPG
jgi:hypothetical protein